MKTFVTLQFLCGWDTAFWLSIEIGGLHAFSDIGETYRIEIPFTQDGLQAFSGNLVRFVPCK